jgi:hypothetical protein
MKNVPPIKWKILFFAIFCFIMFVSCKKDPTEKTEEKSSGLLAATTDESCECQSSWFPHTQTPAPEEGKGSPFDVSSTTNCIFHQWSWQKFLWLTKPDANNNPLFLNQLTQVTDLFAPVAKQSGVTIVLADTEQAGSNGILKANPAYGGTDQIAKDFTVYYSIHSNDIMMKAATNFRDSLATGKLSPNNLRTFPVGSLELKVSWIDANTIMASEQKNYYTTMAAVTTDAGKTYTKKRVALLGMHVVGVVINHPEFIWATFQHNDIAPIYDWKANQVNSADDKLLYSKGTTTGLDGITWTSSGPKLPLKAFDLFQYGVPKTAGDQFMTTCQQEPMNFNNIQSINTCVASQLDDVWNNYFYNGSIWINSDGMSPQQQAQTIVDLGYGLGSAIPGAKARGSLNNANVTMETYTQSFQSTIAAINNTNLANCFSCHAGVSFSNNNKSPIYLSHIFDASIQSGQGKTRDQINSMKDKQHVLRFVKKTLK